MKSIIKNITTSILFLFCSNLSASEKIPESLTLDDYKPVYFISGKPDTKIQFSLKVKVIENIPLYFGYTQKMYWELGKKDSNPFSDINYHPELFFKHNFADNRLVNKLKFGLLHISNGKDKLESRSVNYAYIKAEQDESFWWGLPKFGITLRALLSKDKTNRNIQDFYGPIALHFKFDGLGKWLFKTEELYATYYNGGQLAEDFSKSSIELSLRFKFWDKISAPRLFIQYFNGYNENLKNYDKRSESFRAGISIGGN